MGDGRGDRTPPPTASAWSDGVVASVLVVDDSRLYRDGLALWLAGCLGDGVVRTADSLAGLSAHLGVAQPDVVVLNLASVEAAGILVELSERATRAQLVVVGVDESDEHQVMACAEAGARGYLTRACSLTDLVHVIEEVVAGRTRMSEPISTLVLRRVREAAAERRRRPAIQGLTDREIQILRLIGIGMSNQDIANELTIELHTVKNHVHSLLTKLGVRRRGEAAAMLADWGDGHRESGIRVPSQQRMDPMIHASAPREATS